MANESEKNHDLSSSDSAFTDRLKQLRPAAGSIALEQVLYRAGYEAALRQTNRKDRSWGNFLKGACSGALAASLVWFGSNLTLWSTAPSNEMGLAKESAVELTPKMEAPSIAPPDVAPAPTFASNQAEPLKFVPRFESDIVRNSLSELAKRQWDQRRLTEQKFWISARARSSANADPENTTPAKNSSLWLLRNQASEMIDL